MLRLTGALSRWLRFARVMVLRRRWSLMFLHTAKYFRNFCVAVWSVLRETAGFWCAGWQCLSPRCWRAAECLRACRCGLALFAYSFAVLGNWLFHGVLASLPEWYSYETGTNFDTLENALYTCAEIALSAWWTEIMFRCRVRMHAECAELT